MKKAAGFAVVFLGMILGPLGGAEFVMEKRADLNGDGKAEEISLENPDEGGGFALTVSGITVKGMFTSPGDEADGFLVVDIDSTDSFMEVAVHTPGPSDDDEYVIYWYDGASLRMSGRLARWPKFQGNGFVYVDDWIDFWQKREKYRLDRKSHSLVRVPQEFYHVGLETTVMKSFPIYRTREGGAVVGRLRQDSRCLILVCDSSRGRFSDWWYLIKSTTGLVGWARYRDFWGKLALPLAD